MRWAIRNQVKDEAESEAEDEEEEESENEEEVDAAVSSPVPNPIAVAAPVVVIPPPVVPIVAIYRGVRRGIRTGIIAGVRVLAVVGHLGIILGTAFGRTVVKVENAVGRGVSSTLSLKWTSKVADRAAEVRRACVNTNEAIQAGTQLWETLSPVVQAIKTAVDHCEPLQSLATNFTHFVQSRINTLQTPVPARKSEAQEVENEQIRALNVRMREAQQAGAARAQQRLVSARVALGTRPLTRVVKTDSTEEVKETSRATDLSLANAAAASAVCAEVDKLAAMAETVTRDVETAMKTASSCREKVAVHAFGKAAVAAINKASIEVEKATTALADAMSSLLPKGSQVSASFENEANKSYNAHKATLDGLVAAGQVDAAVLGVKKVEIKTVASDAKAVAEVVAEARADIKAIKDVNATTAVTTATTESTESTSDLGSWTTDMNPEISPPTAHVVCSMCYLTSLTYRICLVELIRTIPRIRLVFKIAESHFVRLPSTSMLRAPLDKACDSVDRDVRMLKC